VLSALYLFAYLSMGIVALGLGVVATERGLGLAVDLGAAAITALSLGTVGLLAIHQVRNRNVPAAPQGLLVAIRIDPDCVGGDD
jgi:hypothetical protein